MGKGSDRRPQKVGVDTMAANWMDTFGSKWGVVNQEGNKVHVVDCYLDGTKWGRANIPIDEDFAVIRQEG